MTQASILMNPRGSWEERRYSLAPRRRTSLNGATVGLVDNGKANADGVLTAIADLLRERYALKAVVLRRKPSFALPAPAALVDELAATCDVVIAGDGD